jgi:hypothetical protein
LWNSALNVCGPKDVPAFPNLDDMSLEDMLTYLADLQQLEENLYRVLTNSAQNITSGLNGLSQAEIDIIVEQINSLSTQRSKIYTIVASMYNNNAKYEERMGSTVAQQLATLKLLEKEMNKSKQLMQEAKDNKLKTMKMVEINTYFSQEYAGYIYLMQVVVGIGVLLLASTFLDRYSPEASSAMFKVVMVVGGMYVFYVSVDIMQRRNTNFDEYTFESAPTTDAQMTTANDNPLGVDISGVEIPICAGSYCCSKGTVWKDNVCVPKII